MSQNTKEIIAEFDFLPPFEPRYDLSYIALPFSDKKFLPSIVQALILELKALLKHLKYIYLGDKETLLFIVAKNLSSVQEEKLVQILRDHKMVIGWTIADIKGISPSRCMHRILLEEGAKPTREAQRWLNPPLIEVIERDHKTSRCGSYLSNFR